MNNLFDIMREAQGGAGVANLSRQFGLDPAQTQRALDALLPAFSLALRRSAQNPAVFADFLQTVLSGTYAPYFDPFGMTAPKPAATPVLGQLFGSPEGASRIAAQASQATGLGLQVMQEMMPVVAGILAGGMLRYASSEGFAELLRQWATMLKTVADQTDPAPPAPADPWSAWFSMIARMSGASEAPPAPRPASPFEAWSRAVDAAMGLPKPAPAPQPAPAFPANPFEAMARMFDAGREVQSQYLAGLENVFESMRAPTPTR